MDIGMEMEMVIDIGMEMEMAGYLELRHRGAVKELDRFGTSSSIRMLQCSSHDSFSLDMRITETQYISTA